MIPDSATTIFERTLHDFLESNAPLDITETAKPQRYRLLDCAAFCKRGAEVIRIFEFQLPDNHELSSVGYAAISYVWRDSDIQGEGGPQFSVKGAEEADPIAVDVLRQTCYASIHRGCGYLWLDRLCIMQTNREDKRWQIQHMNQVYRSCKLCIVLPGGLQRCVRLDEPTLWMSRAWTLQEALVPPEVVVLLSWGLGPGLGCAGGHGLGLVEEITKAQCGIFPLTVVLSACHLGWMTFGRYGDPAMLLVEARVFSNRNDSLQRILAPSVSALIQALFFTSNDTKETRNHAIWQSALTRTSSRPVDMIFSIMGLFGVTLDPANFKTDDRLAATIALAQAILENGGCASWMGACFWLEPCPYLSTFPMFPETRVEGGAVVSTTDGGHQELSELISIDYPDDSIQWPLPRGTMDSQGYMTFRAKAIHITQMDSNSLFHHGGIEHGHQKQLTALNGTSWITLSREDIPANAIQHKHPLTYAVLLGWYNAYFPGITPRGDTKNIRAMLVEEHSPGKFSLSSYFFISQYDEKWVKTWKEHSFCIGGPINSNQPMENQHNSALTARKVSHMSELTTSLDSVLRDAVQAYKWAIPQSVLESYHYCGNSKEVQLVICVRRESKVYDTMFFLITRYHQQDISGEDLDAIFNTRGLTHLNDQISMFGHITQYARPFTPMYSEEEEKKLKKINTKNIKHSLKSYKVSHNLELLYKSAQAVFFCKS